MEREKRVALYARTSTADKQDPEMQLRELHEFAKLRGWKIVSVSQDHGFSGKNTSRPGLKRLMNSASMREIDIVLVWKLDRFARSLPDLVVMIQQLADVGVDFVSLRDNLDLSTSQGRLMLHMLGAFAQFERDLIVSRVKAGLENAKRKGKRLGRPKTRDDAKIMELRANGMSIKAIASLLKVSKKTIQNSIAQGRENGCKTAAVTR